jgi:PAS domain S-box-containing protein
MGESVKKRLGRSLLLKPLLFIAAVACLSIGLFLFISQRYITSHLEAEERIFRQGLISVVSAARSAIEPVLAEVRAGRLGREDAIGRIRPIVRSLTYEDRDGKNYVFMSTYDGTILVLPFSPAQEMMNRIELRDSRGTYILKTLINAAKTRPEGSFVRYYSPHFLRTPASPRGEIEEKLTYVIGLPEIECYIATGMYLDRFINEQKEMLIKLKYASILLLVVVLIPLSIAGSVIFFRNRQLLAETDTRRRAEDELKKSEEKYRSIFENAVEGIFQTSPEGSLISINPAFAHILGYGSPEELLDNVGNVSLIYADPFERKRHIETLNDRGVAKDYIVTLKRRDGSLVCVSANTRAVRDEQGNVIYYEGILEDITERRRAEEQLKESRERLRTVLEHSLDIIYQRNLRKGCYDYISPAIRDITGWSVEEFSRFDLESLFTLVHPDDAPALNNEIARAVNDCREKGRGTCGNEYRLKKKDGDYCWLADSITVLPDSEGNPLYLQGVVRDITERKRLEQRRRELEKSLSRADKLNAIGTLAAGIAHDFNNMLAAIFGYMEMALEKAKKTGQQQIAQYLSRSVSSLERARDLTGQLLTFTKGGAPRKSSLNVADFVKKSAVFSLSGSGILPVMDVDGSITCDFDEVQMARALNNIIINAREAMPEGGRINITVAGVAAQDIPEPYEKGDYVMILVRDHGQGIPRENIARIFDPFFSTRSAHSGLGLTATYSIVRQHGGFITVESEAGKGTVFSIYLPAARDRAAGEAMAPSGLKSGTRRVLVMDDEAQLRDMLSIMLKDMGYDASLAEDGDRALEMAGEAALEGRPFRCAILDLTVPGGRGGKDIIGDLLQIDPEIRIVASSGYSNDPVMADHAAHGFFAKLGKPYSREDLERILESVFGRAGAEDRDVG